MFYYLILLKAVKSNLSTFFDNTKISLLSVTSNRLSALGNTILVVLSSLSITKILHGIKTPINFSKPRASCAN